LIANFQAYATSRSSSIFQCQNSSEQDGHVLIPNYPDFDLNHNNADVYNDNPDMSLTTLTRRRTFIITMPPKSAERNCTGTVVAMRYCYTPSAFNVTKPSFELLSLVQNGTQFTVDRIDIIKSTPTDSICTNDTFSRSIDKVCCDTTPIPPLRIPESSFTFGITPRAYRVLAFRHSSAEYHPTQFQTELDPDLTAVGTNFTLNESDQMTGQPFPLIQVEHSYICGSHRHR